MLHSSRDNALFLLFIGVIIAVSVLLCYLLAETPPPSQSPGQMRKEKIFIQDVSGFSNGTVTMHVVSLDLPPNITDVILKDYAGVEIEVISSVNKEISDSGVLTPITFIFSPENLQVTHEYTVTLLTERGGASVSPEFEVFY